MVKSYKDDERDIIDGIISKVFNQISMKCLHDKALIDSLNSEVEMYDFTGKGHYILDYNNTTTFLYSKGYLAGIWIYAPDYILDFCIVFYTTPGNTLSYIRNNLCTPKTPAIILDKDYNIIEVKRKKSLIDQIKSWGYLHD